MKLVSFEKDGVESYGVLDNESVIDLGAILSSRFPDLKSTFGEGLEVFSSQNDAPVYALSEVSLLPVIPNPGSVWCAGLNTHSHLAEVKAFLGEKEQPTAPMFFLRAMGTLVGSNGDLEIPKTEPAFDYEGEVAAVIGRACRNVTVSDALDYVVGYSCFNDATARLYQKNSEQMTTGKNAWKSGGFGPCLTTSDSVNLDEITLETRVNGETRQKMKMDDLIFSVAELISHISEVYELQSGDVVVTGSAAGIGAAMEPRTFLKPGDVVEVEVDSIGVLTNRIVGQVG